MWRESSVGAAAPGQESKKTPDQQLDLPCPSLPGYKTIPDQKQTMLPDSRSSRAKLHTLTNVKQLFWSKEVNISRREGTCKCNPPPYPYPIFLPDGGRSEEFTMADLAANNKSLFSFDNGHRRRRWIDLLIVWPPRGHLNRRSTASLALINEPLTNQRTRTAQKLNHKRAAPQRRSRWRKCRWNRSNDGDLGGRRMLATWRDRGLVKKQGMCSNSCWMCAPKVGTIILSYCNTVGMKENCHNKQMSP